MTEMDAYKKLLVATILLLLLGFSSNGVARVDINIGVPLPPLVFPAPPPMIVIPGTYAYFSPDVQPDNFFYHGYWYRLHRERWFRSSSYDGPWAYISRPPTVLLHVPPEFRRVTYGHRRIPYGDLHRNWRSWERGHRERW